MSTINQYIQLFRKECQLPRYQMSHKLIGLIIGYGSKHITSSDDQLAYFVSKSKFLIIQEASVRRKHSTSLVRLVSVGSNGETNLVLTTDVVWNWTRAELAGIGARGRRQFRSCIYPIRHGRKHSKWDNLKYSIGGPQYTFLYIFSVLTLLNWLLR